MNRLTTLPLFTFVALLAAVSLLLSPSPASAQNPSGSAPADIFVGESLSYKIDFWLFHGTARGELCFEKTPQGYRAYFEAETKGILSVLTGTRKEIMESVMEYDAARQRLRPRIFREIFIQHKMEFRRTVVFDYEHGSYTCTRIYPGGKPRVTQAALPDTEFEDMLTLYYNFRLGCYGPLRESGGLSVPVIMKEQPSFITIEFPAPGSKERSRGFSAALTMERNLTHARSKRVLARLNESAVLEKALVIDAYFFGDLEVNHTGTTYY